MRAILFRFNLISVFSSDFARRKKLSALALFVLFISIVVLNPAAQANSSQCNDIFLGPSSYLDLSFISLEPAQSKEAIAALPEKEVRFAKPKDWSDAEAKQVELMFNEFARLGLKNFFDTVRHHGSIELYRFAHVEFEAKPIFGFKRYKPNKNIFGVFMNHQKQVHLYDGCFKTASLDIYKGYRLPDGLNNAAIHILFHELVHAYDGVKNTSISSEFINLTNWVAERGDWLIEYKGIRGVDPIEKNRIGEEIARLRKKGRDVEADELGNTFAQKHGFPNFYSMESPSETFAEVLTAVVFDPKVETYMSPQLIDYARTLLYSHAD